MAGVITKPDLIDKGTEQQLAGMVINPSYNLRLGYVMVKCRSQQDVKEDKTLDQALADEKLFFTTQAHFKYGLLMPISGI